MTTLQNLIVETQSGKLEGSYENHLYTFKGIPFAAPPVGELRWMPPQPVKPWNKVRSAKKYGAIAPQNITAPPGGKPIAGFGGVVEPQSENCLFLNVYTPGLDNARRPVMFWIHGGGFSIGSGSQDMFRNTTLAANSNIVLVTTNYRLGTLGFLNLNEVTHGKIPATGNEGLLDQVAALEWVRDNIAAFGGDPQNATIFGESAGGMSVASLMVLPKAQGLFQKAILESAVGEIARPLDASVKVTEEFLDILGIKADDIDALRSLTPEKILTAQQELGVRTGQGIAPAIPVADGKIMPRMPLDAFESGLASKVPTLVGSNLEEQKLFAIMDPTSGNLDETGLYNSAEHFVGKKDAARLIETFRQTRAKRGDSVTPFEIFSALNTELMFRKTALLIAESQCKHAPAGYNYLFNWKSPVANGVLGACHALEIGFVFGNYDENFCGTGPGADKLSHQIQDAWASFARTGNPSCKSLGDWPQYCEGRSSMILGPESHVEKSVYESERAIWDTMEKVNRSKMP